MRLVSRPFPLATITAATANSVTAHTLGVLRSIITTTRFLAYSAINGQVWTRSNAASTEGCQFVVFVIRSDCASEKRQKRSVGKNRSQAGEKLEWYRYGIAMRFFGNNAILLIYRYGISNEIRRKRMPRFHNLHRRFMSVAHGMSHHYNKIFVEDSCLCISKNLHFVQYLFHYMASLI